MSDIIKSQPSYKTEFPDFVLDVTIPEGFYDDSWHNDTMPHWQLDQPALMIWIDYADQDMRELSHMGGQYALIGGTYDNMCDNSQELIIQTDDWQELLTKLEEIQNAKS